MKAVMVAGFTQLNKWLKVHIVFAFDEIIPMVKRQFYEEKSGEKDYNLSSKLWAT